MGTVKAATLGLTIVGMSLFGGELVMSSSLGTAFGHATKPMPRVTVTGKVLLGDAKSFRAVGVVDRRQVFDAIPAMRALRAERISPDSARYHFLVYEANRSFRRALQLASSSSKIDLIVEAGGVSAAGIDVMDLTELTRSMLGRVP